MKKKIIASVIAALLSTTALADTSSMNSSVAGMGILQNEWVKAGVNGTTGTLGSGNGTSPGLLFDPAGTGTFNPSYDYLTPGSPFDGFAVKVDGTNYNNNNAGNTVRITGDGNGLTDGTNSLSWTGGVTGVFGITNTYSLAPNTPYIDITSSITMGVSATTLSFAKYIDPDSQGMPGDSSSTDNVLGYGVIPSTNVAFSEATTSRYALGIYTTDSNVTAGVEGWTQEADGYSGTNYTDGDGNSVNYGNSDDTIGISWTWTGISAGDILTANYAYIFGPSAFEAADSAITGGAGGGADTSSWGTLTDVGSATDAAESGASGGTTTPSAPDFSTASYSDTITAGTVGIIGTGIHAHWNPTTGLYDTRDAAFSGILSMTRESTWTDGTSPVTETFTRTVSGTHNDVMSGYTIGDATRTSQGIDINTVEGTLSVSVAEERNLATGVIDYRLTGQEVFAVATPYTYTYNRTTETTNADTDFTNYTDSTTTETTTSVVTETYTHNTTDRVNREQGLLVTVQADTNQEDVLMDINKSISRNTTFGTIGVDHYNSSYGIYNGSTNIIKVGNTIKSEGLSIGFGIHRIDGNLTGVTSKTEVEGTQVGVTIGNTVNGWDLSGTAQHSMLDYSHSNTPRVGVEMYGDSVGTITVPDMPSLNVNTSGTNTSVFLLAVGPGDIIRPIVGVTHGEQRVDGASQVLGDTGLEYGVEKNKNSYSFATVGAQLNVGPATLTAIRHTDGINNLSIGIGKETDKVTWNVKASKTITDLGDINSLSAGISWKF